MKRITILLCIATGTSLANPGSASRASKALTPASAEIRTDPAGTSHVTFRRNRLPELR